MNKSKDRSSKRCINPWLQFLAIFCVAALTLFMIFEVDSNQIKFNFRNVFNVFKFFSKEDSDDNILIAASGADPKSSVAVQFETCRNFFVFNESTGKYECFSNNPASFNKNTVRDFINQQKIETVITGTMEIDTYQLLNSSNVEVYTGVTGTVEDVLKKYKKHELVSYSRYFNRQKNETVNKTGNVKSSRRVY